MKDTERPKDFLEHMRTVTLAIIESVSGSDEYIDIDIFMGEVIEPSTQELAGVLKYLKEKKALIDLEFEQKNEDFLVEDGVYEKVFVAYATGKIVATEYKKIMERDSLYPRIIIKMRESLKDIVVNNDFIIAKPHDAKMAYYFWEYLIEKPNKKHFTATINNYFFEKNPKVADETFSPNKIVNKYNFTGSVRKLVFPIASLEAVQFRNPVFQRDIDDYGYSEEEFGTSLKKLKPADEKKHLNPTESQILVTNIIESQKFKSK